MSELPVIGGRTPIPVDVEAGKDYFWCACGLSAKQPFCDGSHKTTTFKPTKYTAAETKKTYFCTCKRSSKAPLCDGTHKTLAAEA